MRVAIIGAGFTGLSAGLKLASKGVEVLFFEKEKNPGGLAVSFKQKSWQWPLERHYHHLFESDDKILNFANEVDSPIVFKRPLTSIFVDNQVFQFDSPVSLLQFPKLGMLDKLQMGAVLTFLKLNPFWQPLERLGATEFLPKLIGEKSYKMIWEPLLSSKFGDLENSIPLSWFWARIKKRSAFLGYPKGGFQNLADQSVLKIKKLGGRFFLNTTIENIKPYDNKMSISFFDYSNNRNKLLVDKVIVTLPSFLFIKIAPSLPENYKQKLLKLSGLGALNLMLILKKPFLEDGTYWLNICDKKFPFLSIVEHTNFIDKKYYGNNHIVYVGSYLPHDHPYMQMTADELFKIYQPYLKKINPNYTLAPKRYALFKAPFAQPVPTLNYSKIVPPLETPIKNLYLANIQQIYPWDRGTNYAVELGEKVANLVYG